MQEYLGSHALLKSLENNQVKTIFGYPGGVLLGLYDQIYRQDKIRHILVRHEQAAIHAADGYARIAGRSGVCLATSGPGATNLLTGICSAHMDSIPIVALTGQVPSNMIGKDAFQEADLFNLSIPITKHNYLVKQSQDIPRIIDEAFTIAEHGRQGAVLVDLPKDILNSSFEWDAEQTEVNLPGLKAIPPIDHEAIEQACSMLLSAQKPVLYIGGGVITSQASAEIIQLAELLMIPIVWTLMGKGSISDTHPLNLGMLGMHGTAAANYAVHDSDLLIAIGVRFDDRATGKLSEFAPDAKIIHIDIDPAEISKNKKIKKNIDCAIIGDAKNITQIILGNLNNQVQDNTSALHTQSWVKQVQNWKEQYPLDNLADVNGQITPHDIFSALNKVACDAIYTTDVGQHQMWAAQYIKSYSPQRWITSGGLGTMGFGLPAALGAKIAAQDIGLNKPVICISGDGSFQMCQQELGTLIAHDIPVIVIILNNNNLGMVRQWQELFFERHYSYSHLQDGSPDYVKLADSYGITGMRTNKPEELEDLFEQAIKLNKPVVIDVQMHSEVNVFPIVPPGGANHEAQGVNSPSVPTDRDYNDYIKSVETAPVRKLDKLNS